MRTIGSAGSILKIHKVELELGEKLSGFEKLGGNCLENLAVDEPRIELNTLNDL